MKTGFNGFLFCLLFATVLVLVPGRVAEPAGTVPENEAVVLTQAPLDLDPASRTPAGMPWSDCGDGSRIVLLEGDSPPRVLTEGFHAACDPEISFDGRRMLFSARKAPSGDWDIYEMRLDDGSVRRITRGLGNCRQPVYQGSHYTIVADAPWHQITFVSDEAGELEEHAPVRSVNLYSCRLDGSDVRRLTFNPSSDMGPTVLPDGRLLFSSRQRIGLDWGPEGRIGLFASQTDGIDYAVFSADEGRRIKLMPSVTTERLVVFVENDEQRWDGAGNLASVSLRRNLHSYRRITADGDGLFVFPSPLPDGAVLASRRPEDGSGTYGVVRVDPGTGTVETVFDDPERHDIQARVVAPRPEPDGRASVVTETNPNGVFYGLDVYESDLGEDGWIPRGTPLRLRVLEGIPRTESNGNATPEGVPPLLPRRVLGVVRVEDDGSFNVEVPANVPIQLQLVDEDGLALRSCSWIWVRNRETRGCIGCHEDGERTPDNRFVSALAKPSIPLTLPPDRRRTVDFRRDVQPILDARCSTAACHGSAEAAMVLEGSASNDGIPGVDQDYAALLEGFSVDSSAGTWVHPGRARTSPLIWRLYGRNTSRPWDPPAGSTPQTVAAHPESPPLTAEEKQILAEWIDLGAPWDGIPATVDSAARDEARGGAR
jgi:Tol biopolymer transport system component